MDDGTARAAARASLAQANEEPEWFRAFRPIEWVGMAAVLVLMLHVVVDTMLRFLFNAPLGGTIEFVANWWMVAIVFTGLPLAARRGEHIEAPILWDRLRPADQLGTQLLASVFTLMVLLTTTWFAWTGARVSHERGDYSGGGAVNVLLWPPRYVVFVGLGLYALLVLVMLVRQVRRMASGRPGAAGGEP